MISERRKRELAGRARTLFERLDGPENESGGPAPFDPETMIDEWANRLGGDDQLRRRLERDDLTPEACRRAIGSNRWPADEPLPPWVDRLERLAESLRATTPERRHRAVDRYDDRPFTDLISVIVADARDRLRERVADGPFTDEAVACLAEWLHRRLTRIAVRILYVEFKTFVATHDEELATADPDSTDGRPIDYYDRFVDGLLGDGFVDLCLEYPVFARLLVTRLDQWFESTTELNDRLRADRSRLEERFGDGDSLGAVTGLDALADDTHGDGRAVVRVTFEEGTEIVYKPRGVEPGTLFYGILERLDPHLSVPSFTTPTYLACDGYGWMEWIEHRPCPDERAVARYYERAGALVCLTYLLEFTDCHYENLIAHGEYPVLVDCETIAHPFAATVASERLPELAPLVTESVHLSLLLPFDVEPSDVDADVDPAAVSKLGMEGMSGIGTDADPVRLAAVTNPRIEAANTDVMSISHERPTIHRADNTPHVEGSAQRPGEYLDAIVTGFEETYRTVRRLHDDGRFRDEILRDGSLERIENRFVYRATRRYVSVIDALLSRDPLRDGVRFSVEMERLAAPFFTDLISDDRYWPIYERERAALKRLDPPRITCHVDGRVPSFDGDPIRVSVDRSGYDRCRRRLDSMSESDLRRQRRLLRECFDAADR